MNQKKDLVYVEKLQAGEKAAFDYIYDKYTGIILNYLSKMLNNRSLAEELTQKTLIKVYFNIEKYKATGSFSSWVYAIARNLAKNELKRLSRQKTVSLQTPIGKSDGVLVLADVIKSEDFDVEKAMKSEQLKEIIQKTLNALPLKYKDILVLRLVQQESTEEVMKILKLSKYSVAVRLFRAKKRFMEIIIKMGKEENELPDK